MFLRQPVEQPVQSFLRHPARLRLGLPVELPALLSVGQLARQLLELPAR